MCHKRPESKITLFLNLCVVSHSLLSQHYVFCESFSKGTKFVIVFTKVKSGLTFSGSKRRNYAECFFLHCPGHCSCHGISWHMQAFYVMKLL
jgi:hypothetical protein